MAGSFYNIALKLLHSTTRKPDDKPSQSKTATLPDLKRQLTEQTSPDKMQILMKTVSKQLEKIGSRDHDLKPSVTIESVLKLFYEASITPLHFERPKSFLLTAEVLIEALIHLHRYYQTTGKQLQQSNLSVFLAISLQAALNAHHDKLLSDTFCAGHIKFPSENYHSLKAEFMRRIVTCDIPKEKLAHWKKNINSLKDLFKHPEKHRCRFLSKPTVIPSRSPETAKPKEKPQAKSAPK